MRLQNQILLLSCFVFVSSCGVKTYKPDKALQASNDKAFVQIDGTNTKTKEKQRSKFLSWVVIKKQSKQFKFLGEIKISGNKSNKPIAIKTGSKMAITYQKETYNWLTRVTTYKMIESFLVPKPGDTYVYQYDERDKEMTDMKVFVERDGKRTEFKGFDSDYAKACPNYKRKNRNRI